MLVPDVAGPGGERVKLLDFGIAKLSAERGGEEMTRKGQMLGTATYMSPEQFQGDTTIDGQSDVYSLSVVMYQMLSGTPPFVSKNGELALAAMHMFTQARSLREAAPETSAWLVELIDSMLRKPPAERPTMAVVAAALQEHLPFRSSGRSGIRPASSMPTVGKSESSGIRAVSVQTPPAAEITNPSSPSSPSGPKPAPPPVVPDEPTSQPGTITSAGAEVARPVVATPPKPKQWLMIGFGAALIAAALGGAFLFGRRSGSLPPPVQQAVVQPSPPPQPIAPPAAPSPPSLPNPTPAPVAEDAAEPASPPRAHEKDRDKTKALKKSHRSARHKEAPADEPVKAGAPPATE